MIRIAMLNHHSIPSPAAEAPVPATAINGCTASKVQDPKLPRSPNPPKQERYTSQRKTNRVPRFGITKTKKVNTEKTKSKMKKFNKIQFLESVGLLNKRFNFKRLKFECSPYLLLRSYLILLYQLSFILKFFVSTFFKKEDIVQLWIGSPLNYLDGKLNHLT